MKPFPPQPPQRADAVQGVTPISISAVVLTHQEELNLQACLSSLEGWCGQIFVVDSGSTDQTVAIARQAGAQVFQHPFETHAKQWNWALKNLPFQGGWILALDADQRVSPELREEILKVLPGTPAEVVGYYLPRKQIFRGRWIRHGGYWTKHLLKLFRKGLAWADEKELVDFRFYVRGKTRCLKQPLAEENEKEKEIIFWLEKHLRFIELQAREEHLRRHEKLGWAMRPSLFGTPDQRILFWKRLWYRMPLFVRPFLYFGYRYFLRLGILDGPQGTLFHFLQAFWFRWMVDVRLQELERG